MVTASQTGDELSSFGSWEYPRLVGALVVCGLSARDAAEHVRHVTRRHLATHPSGGGDGVAVRTEVLRTVRPPVRATTTDSPVGRALTSVPWPERLGTVATLVLDDDSAGPGQPEVVAARLREEVGDCDDLATVLAEEVQRVAPAPDPGLADHLRAELRRDRRSRVATAVALVAAVIAVIVFLLTRRDDGGPAAAASSTTSIASATPAGDAVPAGAITQWVAVLDVGTDAFSLYPQVEEVGRIVGVNVFTDRWACYRGFPDGADPGRGDWFLAIAAQDKAEVDALVARVGRTPMAEAQVQGTCLPPPPDDRVPVLTGPPTSTP